MIPAIGLSGFAGSGKTTVANYLEQVHGYRRHHIATPLREMCSVLLDSLGYSAEAIYEHLEGRKKEEIIPGLGVSGRHLQITLGTEWGREYVSEDLWVMAWTHTVKSWEGAMNDSVRFPNEEEAIKGLGGITLMIERPGLGPIKFTSRFGRLLYQLTGNMWGVHPSERLDQLNPGYRIVNDGTIEQLFAKVDEVIARAKNDRWIDGVVTIPTRKLAA
ncbi:hypothetical protein PUR29_34580 [Methylobacterium ajmalii]|uniref:Deoxynucleotide monophosphate kinase n=1 Tax=Methylobacterium ajmalii TaxID=2738439 RepID=A0ABV0A4P2_9HYPH